MSEYEMPPLTKEAKALYRKLFGYQRVSANHMSSVREIEQVLEETFRRGQQHGWVE